MSVAGFSSPQADFGRTRWSIVRRASDANEADAQQSLVELCRRYWVPVYAYVRRCGHSPQGAATLVQAFLSDTVRRIRAGEPVTETGFREFLQHRLERFLAGNRQGPDGTTPMEEMAPPWPLEEIERRQPREHLPQLTPAEAFQRAFAVEMLTQGLASLRAEAASCHRERMFEAMRPYLTRELAPDEYAQLAQTLDCSPLATLIAIKRLRQRYQELVEEQLAQTVGARITLDGERDLLLAMLSGAGTP